MSDKQPTLIDRLRSYLTADTDEAAVYDGDRCPHCTARLAMTQVEDRKSRTVAKSKFCQYCGWEPGKEPDRTPEEARQIARARAELAGRAYEEMMEDEH